MQLFPFALGLEPCWNEKELKDLNDFSIISAQQGSHE
jgi:hypothetical protein